MTLPPLPLPLAAFGRWDWVVVGGYFALMATIGARAARRKTDARGYFLAERSMPTFAVALSVVATALSVATFVGAPESAFKGDLTYLSTNLGGFLAVFIVATLFIPRFYRAGTVTIYGFLDRRFGPGAVIATSLAFLVGRLLASGVRLFIAAIPVCFLMFGRSQPGKGQMILAIALIGAVGTAYTIAGGIRAVIWTDTVQILIVFGAAALSLLILLHEIPLPLGRLVAALADPGSGPSGPKLRVFDLSADWSHPYSLWTSLLAVTFLNVASYGVDHDLAQRMLTARSAWRGGASLIVSQVIGTCVAALFLGVGLLLWVYYRRPDLMGAAAPADAVLDPKQVYPQFLVNHMPSGLSGLAIAGMLAAAQGSLDSAINAMASSAVADVYWPLRRRAGKAVETGARAKAPRLAVAAMGALLVGVAVAAAFWFDPKSSLIEFALGVMSFAYTGMLGVFLTALFTRRGNTASVLAALGAGFGVVLLWQPPLLEGWTARLTGEPRHWGALWAMPVGTTVSFLVCLAGSRRVASGDDPLPGAARPSPAPRRP